jgi:copper chaperone
MQGAHQVLLLPRQEVAVTSLSLSIEGMSCHHCLNAVSKALAALPGVTIEAVRIGRADVSFDPAEADAARIAAAITEAGYRAHAVSGQ